MSQIEIFGKKVKDISCRLNSYDYYIQFFQDQYGFQEFERKIREDSSGNFKLLIEDDETYSEDVKHVYISKKSDQKIAVRINFYNDDDPEYEEKNIIELNKLEKFDFKSDASDFYEEMCGYADKIYKDKDVTGFEVEMRIGDVILRSYRKNC